MFLEKVISAKAGAENTYCIRDIFRFSLTNQFYFSERDKNLMNKIILSGRLAQDPEQRNTQSGTEMATFNLAVNRKRDHNTTDFFRCFCMGQNAKYLLQYGAKGMSLELTGECQLGSYTDKNGAKQQTVNIFATEIDFTSKNPNLQNNQQSGQSASHPQQNAPQVAPAPQGSNGNYQQRSTPQAPNYRNSAPIYQDACRGRQQQSGNGFAPGRNGNGYPAPPAYAQPPKTDFLDIPDGIDECPFN